MAGLTVQQLQSFNPGGFTSAASAFETASQATNSSQSSLQAAAGSMGDWAGPAADAANNTMSSMLDALTPTPPLLEGAQQVLESFVTAVSMAQEKLSSSVRQAQSLHCTVAPDGTVTPPTQPAGEPPQVCFANPQQEAARVKAQNAYDQSPQVQGWDNAVKQAPALQSAIQGALHDAAAADSRASGDLSRTSGGAKDFTLVAGGNTGAPLTDLTGDQLSVQADGAKWSQYFAGKAATLARKAATNPNAARQLGQDYGNLARTDAAFSTAVLNQLGAKGMEQLVTQEGYHGLNSYNPDPPSDPLLQFLSNSLATGTAQIDDPVAQVDGNSVSSDYLQQLISASNNNQAPHGQQAVPGWWALGQILDAAGQKGQTPYGTTFLTTVGAAMVQWDKDHNNKGQNNYYQGEYGLGPVASQGINQYSTDPVVGLLTAAATNPTGDQQLLATQMTGNKSTDVLTYLIADHHWGVNQTDFGPDGGSDGGAALGHAFQVAADAPGGTRLAIEGINVYGTSIQHSTSYGSGIPGFRTGAGNVLANHIVLLNDSINPPASSSQLFNTRDLAYSLSQIGQDPHGYHAVLGAQLLYTKTQLANAVDAKNPSESLSGAATESANALGFIAGSRDQGLLIAGKSAQAAALKQQAEISSLVNDGVGFIPLPAPVVSSANAVLASTTGSPDLGTLVSKAWPDGSGAVAQAVDTTASDAGSVHQLVSQMVISAAASHPQAYGLGSPPPDLTTPITTSNAQEWEQWISTTPDGHALGNFQYNGINGTTDGVTYAQQLVPSS